MNRPIKPIGVYICVRNDLCDYDEKLQYVRIWASFFKSFWIESLGQTSSRITIIQLYQFGIGQTKIPFWKHDWNSIVPASSKMCNSEVRWGHAIYMTPDRFSLNRSNGNIFEIYFKRTIKLSLPLIHIYSKVLGFLWTRNKTAKTHSGEYIKAIPLGFCISD